MSTVCTDLCFDLLNPGTIVYRMLALRKHGLAEYPALQRFSGSARLVTISRVFIESALLYTSAVGLSVVMEVINNDAFYATTDIVS